MRAGAVIMATGGNAFRSGAMGTNGVTGDGYLMAAEVGVDLVGMEFSGHYGLAPLHGNSTKGGMFFQGHIFDDHGIRLDPMPSWFAVPNVARALINGRRVYTVLEQRRSAKTGTPCNLWNVRKLLRVFCAAGPQPSSTISWPTGLVYEGTVRALGGLIVEKGCSTSAPGLFAAGDVTDRTHLTGAFLSGAGPAVAWCVASGEWAGKNAAAFSRGLGDNKHDRAAHGTGQAGLRPGGGGPIGAQDAIKVAQDEILPLDKNYFRTESKLIASLGTLHKAWDEVSDGLAGVDARGVLKSREAASLVATGRWIYTAALRRTETRGLHRRDDYSSRDERQTHNLRVGGLDAVSVSKVAVPTTVLAQHGEQPVGRPELVSSRG